MAMRIFIAAVAIFFCAGGARAESAQARFEQLKALAGDWTATTESGGTWTLTYRPIANGSAIIESWKTRSGRETMTVFHMDGDRLLATHYCGQGSQPRFQLASPTDQDRMDFALLDITNLASAAASHQHGFTVGMEPDGALIRTETYRSKGQDETTRLRFTRIIDPR